MTTDLEQRRLLVKANALTNQIRDDFQTLGADSLVKKNARLAIYMLQQFLKNADDG